MYAGSQSGSDLEQFSYFYLESKPFASERSTDGLINKGQARCYAIQVTKSQGPFGMSRPDRTYHYRKYHNLCGPFLSCKLSVLLSPHTSIEQLIPQVLGWVTYPFPFIHSRPPWLLAHPEQLSLCSKYPFSGSTVGCNLLQSVVCSYCEFMI